MNSILARGQKLLLAFAALYTLFLFTLTIPFFQNHVLYLHAARWPLFSDFKNPVKYGLPYSRTLNIELTTRDNIKLGSWLLLPPSHHLSQQQATVYDSQHTNAIITSSLSTNPTVLFLHGNAAARAVSFRIEHYISYAAHFNANVLAIDYRGFGDSEGEPSEEGLVADARAAWDWVIEKGARPEDVMIIGHSLGTGVSASLGAELALENIQPKGIVLLAPFTSLPELLADYSLFGFLPVLQPIYSYPLIKDLVLKYLITQFNTSSALLTINCPIVLAHSENDFEIRQSHSESLFNNLLKPYLPSVPESLKVVPVNPAELKYFDWDGYKAYMTERKMRKDELVKIEEMQEFGSVHRFSRPGNTTQTHTKSEAGDVIFVKAKYGGHDRIGIQHTLIDFIANEFFSRSNI